MRDGLRQKNQFSLVPALQRCCCDSPSRSLRLFMAISTRSKWLLSRLETRIGFQRFYEAVAGEELKDLVNPDVSLGVEISSSGVSPSWLGNLDASKWKKVPSRYFGITKSMIPPPLWTVMSVLRRTGFEAYLVGGCVRDLILRKIPKDFDVITTASLDQIMSQFRRCRIVGQRFPICMVHINSSIIEVSSFNTSQDTQRDNFDIRIKPDNCGKEDFMRWKNSMLRDFTINSLFFDPFINTIYDYANAMKDLRSLKLQTLIPAQLSFEEDCARIFRGIRIAARLGLSFSKDIETAILNLSPTVMRLAKALYLLKHFKSQTARSSIMLMNLLSRLDKLITCDRPADNSLWIGLLAFHLALLNTPQDALVVWTLSSVLYCGSWKKGLKFARQHAGAYLCYVPEMLSPCALKSDIDLAADVAQLVWLVQTSVHVFTEPGCLFDSLSKFSVSTSPGVVFIPKKTGLDVYELFDVLVKNIESYDDERRNVGINYFLLGKGDSIETRHVLGKIIMDTMSNGAFQLDDDENPTAEKVKTGPEIMNQMNEHPKKEPLKKSESGLNGNDSVEQMEVPLNNGRLNRMHGRNKAPQNPNLFQEMESKCNERVRMEHTQKTERALDSDSLWLSCLFGEGESERDFQSSPLDEPIIVENNQSSSGLKKNKKTVLSEKMKNLKQVSPTEKNMFSLKNKKEERKKKEVLSQKQKNQKQAAVTDIKKNSSPKIKKQEINPKIGLDSSSITKGASNKTKKKGVSETKKGSSKNAKDGIDPKIGAKSPFAGILEGLSEIVSSKEKRRGSETEKGKGSSDKKTSADPLINGILEELSDNVSSKEKGIDPDTVQIFRGLSKNSSSKKEKKGVSETTNGSSPKNVKEETYPKTGATHLEGVSKNGSSKKKMKKGALENKKSHEQELAATEAEKTRVSTKNEGQKIDLGTPLSNLFT